MEKKTFTLSQLQDLAAMDGCHIEFEFDITSPLNEESGFGGEFTAQFVPNKVFTPTRTESEEPEGSSGFMFWIGDGRREYEPHFELPAVQFGEVEFDTSSLYPTWEVTNSNAWGVVDPKPNGDFTIEWNHFTIERDIEPDDSQLDWLSGPSLTLEDIEMIDRCIAEYDIKEESNDVYSAYESAKKGLEDL